MSEVILVSFPCVADPRLSIVKFANSIHCSFHPSEDSVRFYPLSRHTLGQVETWGVGPDVTEAPGSVII